MDTDRIRKLLDFVILIPGIHLGVCLTYIFLYNYSFGYGLSHFSSPADVFSISLAEVVPIYVNFLLFGGLGLIAGGLARRNGGSAAKGRPPRSIREADRIDWLTFGSFVLVVISMAVLFSAYRIAYQYTAWSMLFFILSCFITVSLYYIAFFPRYMGPKLAMIGFAAICLSAVAGNALQKAVNDRTVAYSETKDILAWCGRFMIVRAVSSNFLAIGPNNARVIIDGDCNEKYILLSSDRYKQRPQKSGYDAVKDAWAQIFR